jgi:ABC-type branched-subunit amino acid transport system ATPase component
MLDGKDLTGQAPHRIVARGLARSFQITNLFPSLAIEENLRLAVQAGDSSHFDGWRRAASIPR